MARRTRPDARRATAALLAVIVALGAAFGSIAAAQSSDFEILRVDRSDEPQISLTVSIPGGAEALPASSFSVTEDGEPREVTVEQIANDTLAVVLAIDTSGSMAGEPIEAAKAAANAFITGLPSTAAVAIVGFGETPQTTATFTTDRAALTAAVDSLVAEGETALYDAIIQATGLFPTGPDARRTLVVLSDGGDTASAATIDDATRTASTIAGQFFGVELQTPDSNRAVLDALAEAAGGRTVGVADASQLSAAYAALASELTSQYRVTFTSARAAAAEVVLAIDAPAFTGSSRAFLEAPPVAAPDAADTPRVSVPAADPFTPELGFFDQAWVLWAGAALLFVALALVFAALAPEEAGPLSRFARGDEESGGETAMQRVGERISDTTEALLGGSIALPDVQAKINEAGMSWRAGETIALGSFLAIVGFLAGLWIDGILLAVILGAFGALFIPALLSVRSSRRRRLFDDQLNDALPMLAGSLRAGYGIIQGIDNVARESPSPIADEFSRVIVENRLGRDLSDSLSDVALRTKNRDFEWVAQAIEIHRQVGGDLAKILDTVAATIRARNRLRRQVRVLASEGKASALVLMALPFIVLAATLISSPGYVDELFDTTAGNVMLLIGAGLLVVGGLWLRRIVKPEI